MHKDSKRIGQAGLFPLGASSSAIFEVVRVCDGIARSALPQRTLLSQQSVHRLTEQMCRAGLLRRNDPVITGRGKPSPYLSLCPGGAYGIGVSVDTSSVQVVWVDLLGNVLSQGFVDANPNNPEMVADATFAFAMREGRRLALPETRVAGCGVSIQGWRAGGDPAVFVTPKLLGAWSRRSVDALLGDRFGIPIYPENNGTLGAIAEMWCGAGRQYPTFVYLSFNYGFGGGLVLNGKPFGGAHMNAGELSRLYLPAEHPVRPALSGLLRMLQESGIDIRTVDQLARHFDPDWPGVEEWLEQVSPALRQLVRAIRALIDPAAIIFGGEAPAALKAMLIERCNQPEIGRHGYVVPSPNIVQSQIPIQPSVVGAAIQAIRCRLLGAG